MQQNLEMYLRNTSNVIVERWDRKGKEVLYQLLKVQWKQYQNQTVILFKTETILYIQCYEMRHLKKVFEGYI